MQISGFQEHFELQICIHVHDKYEQIKLSTRINMEKLLVEWKKKNKFVL